MPVRSVIIVLALLVNLVPITAGPLKPPPQSQNQIPIPPPPPPEPEEPKPSQEKDEAVRLSARLVLVPVSVSNAAGRPVLDLTAADFVIEEEGKPQAIQALGEPGKTPIEIALLFDISGSIHGQFSFEQQAAVGFLKQVLKPGDAVSVFAIGTAPRMVRGRTTGADEATAAVMSLTPLKEATALFDSVVEAARYAGKTAEAGSRRVLVTISDGEENYSKRKDINHPLQELQKNDCLFYAINPSGSALTLNRLSVKGQASLEAMSSQTGGKAFVPERIDDLKAVFDQIAEELQAQYLFGYYAPDEASGGGFRRITVRAPRRPELRVRARQGYYATTPASASK